MQCRPCGNCTGMHVFYSKTFQGYRSEMLEQCFAGIIFLKNPFFQSETIKTLCILFVEFFFEIF